MQVQVGPQLFSPAGLLPQSRDGIGIAVIPCRNDDRRSYSLEALPTVEEEGVFWSFHRPN